MTTVLLVAAGGAVGAVLRYLATWYVTARYEPVYPWATLLVNVVGSATLGMLVAGRQTATLPLQVTALLGTGLCGALTTYSSFTWESLRLAETRGGWPATRYVAASVGGALAAAALGWAVGQGLWA